MPNIFSTIPTSIYFFVVAGSYLTWRIHKCRVKEIKACTAAIKSCDESGSSTYELTEGRHLIERTYGGRVYRKALKEV